MNDSPSTGHPQETVSPRFRLKRREKWLLVATAILASFALLFGSAINRTVLTFLVLHSEKPAKTVVDELAGKFRDPVPFLERLWKTDKIPHRLLAMSFIKERAPADPVLFARIQSLVLAAATDPDLAVRALVFETLAAHRHAKLLPLAKAQFLDADSHARLLGLKYLRSAGSPQLVPVVIPLLDDPDPAVVVAAANTLRLRTGQDFGIRLSQAARKLDDTSGKPDPADAEALARGVQRWKEWWKLHQADYPNQTDEPVKLASCRRLPTPDVSLEDLEGKTVRLSEFKGKTVLLNFWDSETLPSMNDMYSLIELQRRNSDRLVVLGISLDSSIQDRSCCAHEHEGAPHPKKNLREIRTELLRVAKEKGLNYRLLIDRTGAVGRRFNDDELANNVLFDADGYLRRRFVGGRTLAALQAIINEAAPPVHFK